MIVLDLFCGLKGWSEPFLQRGHTVYTLDIDPKFQPDYVADILEINPKTLPSPDIILASPPCEAFSVLRIGRNWTGPDDNPPHHPKTSVAKNAYKIVSKTLDIIDKLEPTYFIIENPRAKLRKLDLMQGLDRKTVTYCQYGEKFMKPTDLWGGFPPSLELKPICKNGAPCHVSAPRGSTSGIQGYGAGKGNAKTMAALRAKIPYALALDVCMASEADIL